MAEQGDAVVNSSTGCLLSLQNTQSLLSPIEGSKKIRYTCITASPSYVALGANTGGVYCFHRDGYKYIRILASKEGSVSQVRFSPNENNMAVCSGGGFVGLWELNLHEQGVSKRLHVSSVLKDATVKDMVWDNKGNRVFFGDDLGRVAVTYIPKQKLFKKPDEIILQEKVPVVQMDVHQEQLLISTQTRCLLFKLLTRELVQVGTRARDGPFGACFHTRWPDRPPVVFSARPGGRLWQADVEGTVVSTLKLKDAVSMPAVPILGTGFQPVFPLSTNVHLSHPLNFSNLQLLHNTYMVGWIDKNLFLFEPAAYRLAAWTSDLGSIMEVYSDGRQLFVLSEGVRGVQVCVVSFVSLETCVQWLVKSRLLVQASQVLEVYSDEILLKTPTDEVLYNDVKTTLESLEGKELVLGLKALESCLSELKEKFDQHIRHENKRESPDIVEVVDLNGDSNIENTSNLEDTDGGFQTVDLTAFSDPNLDGYVETDDCVISNTDHMTTNVNHMTDEKPIQDPSADFPIHTSGADYLNEPDLDSTLIPDDPSSGHSDSESLHLNSSSVTSIREEDVNLIGTSDNGDYLRDDSERDGTVTETKSGGDGAIADSQAVTEHLNVSPFHEELGTEIPSNVSRSMSRTIPPRVQSQSSLASHSAGNSESGTSVLSSSFGGQGVKISLSEPQSLENRSSFDSEHPNQELLPIRAQNKSTKASPDFANRVAAALLSCSPDNDDGVVAVPVRSLSGGSKESGKTRSKKKNSRRKKSVSPVHSLGRRLSTPELSDSVTSTKTPSPRSMSLVHIPEEEMLPFPEAGLPPTPPTHTSHTPSIHSSAASSQNVSPLPSLPSTPPRYSTSDTLINSSSSVQNGFLPRYPDSDKAELVSILSTTPTDGVSDSSRFGGLQKPSALLSKVKSIAKQGGVNLMESNKIQRQVKMVKGLLSSLANPPHTSQLMESQQNVFRNDNYGFLSPIMASPPLSPPVEEGEMVGSPPPHSYSKEDQSTEVIPQLDPDTADFVAITITTARKLEDPEVYCSPETMSALLQKWLSKLQTYREHLCSSSPLAETTAATLTQGEVVSSSDVEKPPSSTIDPTTTTAVNVFYSPSYLQINTTVRQMVTDLASLYAELGLYGNSSELSPPRGEAAEGLVEFVCRYGTVLDPLRLRHLLSELDWKERVGVWKQLAEMYKEDAALIANPQASIQDLCSKESTPSDSHSQLPALLLRLLGDSSQSFLDACVACFPNISPWEVLTTCEINQSSDSKQSHDNHKDQSDSTANETRDAIYVSYLNQFFTTNERKQRGELIPILSGDPQLLFRSLDTSLSYWRRLGVSQEDNHHISQRSVGQLVEQLVELCVLSKTTELLDRARELCQCYRYWVGVVWLSVAMGDKRKALHVMLCLKDLSLFTNEQKWGNLLNSLDDWKLLIELMSSCDTVQAGLFKQDQTSPSSLPSVTTAPLATPTLLANPPSSAGQETKEERSSTAHKTNVLLDQGLNSVEAVNTDRHDVVSSTGEHTPNKPQSQVSTSESRTEDGPSPLQDSCLSDRSKMAAQGQVETNKDLPGAGEIDPLVELTWSGVLRLMIGSLPPTLVIKLLSSCHGDRFGICEQLHTLLSQLTQIQTKQRSLGHSLLERVDRYLWSPRPSALGPQLLSVQNTEKQAYDQSQDLPTSSMLTSVPTVSGSIEDATTHWGVHTQLGPSGALCPLCRLSILSPVSDLRPGVVVLRCGHSFHKRCLPELACVVCFATNVRDKVNINNMTQ